MLHQEYTCKSSKKPGRGVERMSRVDYFSYNWILLSLDTYTRIKEQYSISLQTKQKSIQEEEKKWL